jgi:AGZA family xanthine/uracil permease-like MFS transporter
MIGLLSLFVSLIPRAVIAPIFIFIGFEIMRQAYNDSPPAHSPAVSLSILPVVASLVLIILGQFTGALGAALDKLPVRLQVMHQTLTMLSNGFIITGLLWGSMLAFLIDQKAKLAALCALVCAVLTLFGIIHSVMPTGELYLPWHVMNNTHYMVATAYFALSGILLSLTGKKD